MTKRHQFLPNLPPPEKRSGVLGWLKTNLFSTPFNAIISLLLAYLAFIGLSQFIQWAFLQANWIGETKAACQQTGACWVFIQVRFEQFMFGFYPESERWRPLLFFIFLFIFITALIIERIPKRHWIFIGFIFTFPFVTYFLLFGGYGGLAIVDTHLWGGLLITLIISIVGIVLSLPIGILLALGRRSHMPMIRALSTIYIEVLRGVPLITILFMASVMLPLFMADGSETNKLIRALIGVVMFASAYMAEVIRGGLQTIPAGQYEAAQALGFNYWQQMRFIILPQALTLTIPSIVNTFIGLFKDTSLVLIIGMFDVLGIGQAANSDPNWLGFATESYVFVAFIFWAFCFGMSRYTQ